MTHPSAAAQGTPRPRPPRTLAGAVGGIGLLLLGLACEPGITTAPDTAGSVRLSPRGVSFEMGDSLRATAAALDEDGITVLSGRRVQWSSSQPSVARVDSIGWIHGMMPGSAVISASIDGFSDTATVTILAPAVLRLELSPDTATVILGQTKQLVAATYGRRDTLLTGRVVSWTSSIPGVAAISPNGLVTAAGLGTAVITAISEGHLDTTRITVVPVPVKRLPVSPNPATVQLGTVLQLSADPQDSTGTPLPGRSVSFVSGNSAIASVTMGGLVTGVAVGTTNVTATSEGVSTVVPVTVSAPVISLSRTTVTMTDRATGPNPAPELINVTNGGAFTLSGLARSISYGPGASGWLAATFNQTTAPATLTLQATTGSLAPGTYTATVTVSSNVAGVAPVNVGVTFTVVPQPQIALSQTSPSFGAQTSGPNPSPVVVDVTNGGTGTLSGLSISTSYAGGQPTGWLGASLAATTAPTTITLQPVTGSLATGTYNATVTVSSTLPNVVTRTIDVTFSVVAGPAIGLSSTQFNPGAVAFATTPVAGNISVTNLGNGTLDGLSTSIDFGGGPTGWLTASLVSTVAPTTLQLSASAAARSAGTYTAVVTVSSTVPGATPRTVSVTFTVGPQPIISVNPTSASFDVTRGAALPAAVVSNVSNSGGGTLSGLSRSISYGPGATGWLDATLGGTSAPTTLSLRPNTTSLVGGTYTATVTLSSTVPGVANVDVPVTLVVRQPLISLSTSSVALGSRTRGAAIASSIVSVTNGGQGTLSGLSSSDDASWITTSLSSTTATSTLTIAYDTDNLVAGTYNGTVTVSSTVPGTTAQTVSVSITVLQPQIGLSVTSASRSVVVGNNATSVSSTISNTGSGTLSGLGLGTTTYAGGASGWASASLSTTGGGLPASVSITLNTSSITTAGTFTATIPVTSTVPGVATQNVTVTVTTIWSFAAHISPLMATCNGCHTFTTWSSIVNVAPTLAPCAGTGWVRISPNSTTNSLIYRKLADASPPCGTHMPNSTTFWSASDLARLASWINNGAPNN